MPKIRTTKTAKQLPRMIVKQMLVLATGGFSLIAALAWNEFVKAFIEEYVKPYATKGSGLTAQFIYAVVITAFIVIVTLFLTWFQGKLEGEKQEES